MSEWNLTDAEWDKLAVILGTAPARTGRPRKDNTRGAAEAVLFHHFHSLSRTYRTFGWNDLPKEFGVSPSTANRRYREWLASGAWVRFWDALMDLRRANATAETTPEPLPASPLNSPVRLVVTDLERAFLFLNGRFFAGKLPASVVITLEDQGGRRRGYFCGRRWRTGKTGAHHIMLHTSAVADGLETALAVLLHEMVHLRNYDLGIADTSCSQYHNRHFRDAALLAGLECVDYEKGRGYAHTRLDERGQAAVAAFPPGHREAFDWFAGKQLPTQRLGCPTDAPDF